MEETKKTISGKIKGITIIAILIIIVGIIMTSRRGLNFNIKYRDSQKIDINIGQDFEISDIKSITDEVLGEQEVIIQKVEVYKDSVSIRTSEISEEQKQDLINKINEKYGKEIKAENITVKNIPRIRGREIIEPYIYPFLITTGIILGYMIIRYYKLNILKVLLKTILIIGVGQLLVLSIGAILYLSINNIILAGFLIYMISLSIGAIYFEKQLEELKNEEPKKV